MTTEELVAKLNEEIRICKQDGSAWCMYLVYVYQSEIVHLLQEQLYQFEADTPSEN